MYHENSEPSKKILLSDLGRHQIRVKVESMCAQLSAGYSCTLYHNEHEYECEINKVKSKQLVLDVSAPIETSNSRVILRMNEQTIAFGTLLSSGAWK